MAPQFVLLGLPTMQIGHEIYHDILVKYNLCYTAINSTELRIGLTAMKRKNASIDDIEQHKQLIYNAIGYTSEWSTNLRHIIFSHK
ncbi:unnamed protein product [Adineta steineri]|uniref:Uncharacterized protein n=1 Tax=Adineta steineri TaxID=433720 RepID=A0A815UZL0_9BILA|nr:unnamed protein product [Adineta steineri]CAF1653088.1 unnamed protein product [Adineta steineri]